MKKKMLGLLLATAMGATLLAGCGSSNTGAASSTDTAKTETAVRKQKIPVQRQQVSQPGNRRSR